MPKDKLKLTIKKTHADAYLPVRGSKGAAGYDLFALEDVKTDNDVVLIRTGLAMIIPDGYYGRIAARSSMARNRGFHVGGGVVDSDYRGEIHVVLLRSEKDTCLIAKGSRVAQLIIEKCVHPEIVEVQHFPKEAATERGEKGFGSTGT